MSVSIATFRTRFPELTEELFPDDRVTLALDDALLQMNVYVWGTKADLGQAYLAAHLLCIEGDAFGGVGGGALGALTQESVGDVSRSFSVPGVSITDSDRDLTWTKYGVVFSRMKKTLVSTPVVL